MNEVGNSANAPVASSTSDVLVSPPRAPLTFRVGIVGHRPNRLANADLNRLAAAVRSILDAVGQAVLEVSRNPQSPYDGNAPRLRAISPLAEGADRLFAEQALELGFELCCVMPFPQAEFEKDFDAANALEADSLDRFRKLLGQAGTRFEMDGNRVDAGAAYGAAGRVVLNQSDLLVVVWDGERQDKRGGTEETFDEARRRSVPVVWVDAHAPHDWQLLDASATLPQSSDDKRLRAGGSGTGEALQKWVHEALDIPMAQGGERNGGLRVGGAESDPRRSLQVFYAERQPRWTMAVVWKAFRDIVGDSKSPRVTFTVAPFEEAVVGEWPCNNATPIDKLVSWLRPFYAWPDRLAALYSDGYRSAYILAFLLAAIAVGMALMPIGAALPAHDWAETLSTALEFLAILAILALVFLGRHRQWHERWMDYRLVAELVRHLRLVAPLGGARPFPQIPAHWGIYGQPGASWMAWYVRAIERALGLPFVVVDKAHVQACLKHLGGVVGRQIEYHAVNARRCHKIEQRLHHWGIGLFTLTLLACALHLLPGIWHAVHLPGWLPAPHVLLFIGGFFPALGAALLGINNQGEFRRITKRSTAMQEHLERLFGEIKKLEERLAGKSGSAIEQFSVSAAALASDVTRLLVNEVLDWRVVLLDRPLEPPA